MGIAPFSGLSLAGLSAPGAFPYLTRVVPLPPLVAQAAFDEVRRARRLPQPGDRWDVNVPAGTLELHGPGRVTPPPRRCFWAHREVRGRIHAPGWPLSIPVRLELVPWSGTESALGLSVVNHRPLLTSDHAYLDVGPGALGVLADDLEGWAFHGLRELAGSLHPDA
ncbi:MAG TPA: hypothetical protein VHL53_20755 [Acidimicrobiia bacterium]|nr:hypothetical protein [Acidimicrobiia bacterium]